MFLVAEDLANTKNPNQKAKHLPLSLAIQAIKLNEGKLRFDPRRLERRPTPPLHNLETMVPAKPPRVHHATILHGAVNHEKQGQRKNTGHDDQDNPHAVKSGECGEK